VFLADLAGFILLAQFSEAFWSLIWAGFFFPVVAVRSFCPKEFFPVL